MTIRATVSNRPEYGASSCLRNSRNQSNDRGDSVGFAQVRPCSIALEWSQRRIRLLETTQAEGSLTRTRTGYLEAKWTQLSVRCASGRPGAKVPKTSASGVTPKPMLSTTPENRTSGFDRT